MQDSILADEFSELAQYTNNKLDLLVGKNMYDILPKDKVVPLKYTEQEAEQKL